MFFPQSKKPLFTPTDKSDKLVLHIAIFSVLETRQYIKFSNLIMTNIFRIFPSPTFIMNHIYLLVLLPVPVHGQTMCYSYWS